MYVERQVSAEVLSLFEQYPIVTITGPRQSGKSTLCEHLFPTMPYFSLEDPDHRDFANNDPRGFLKRCGERAIIDEVQRVPEILSYLQTLVDKRGVNGQFVLTGSSQFELMETTSQSLAGRTALVRLLPFSLKEICSKEPREQLDLRKVIHRGFYPRVVAQDQDPAKAYAFYVDTYVEKDVRRIRQIQDMRTFEVFLRLCAGRTGQLLNYSELGAECGIDIKTVQRWLSVLEAGYIVKTVRPYYRNLNKRLVKTPKLYFHDTGLACFLLGIRKPEHLDGHPLFGALFETYVMGELVKSAYNRIENDDIYFFRDSRGREVDVVRDCVTAIDIMEIKSGRTVNNSFFKGLEYLRSLPIGVRSAHIVYGGDESYERNGIKISGWRDIPSVNEL